MNRNVTAIYRTHSIADLVRRELVDAGVGASAIRMVPGGEAPVAESGRRDDNRYLDELHDLQVPESDLRTYQHSVRNGDHVVSVQVDDAMVDRVRQIMKRPEAEARDFGARDQEFTNEPLVPHSNAQARRDAEMAWQPDASTDGMRSYRRDRTTGGI